jgi:hypothetical protein
MAESPDDPHVHAARESLARVLQDAKATTREKRAIARALVGLGAERVLEFAGELKQATVGARRHGRYYGGALAEHRKALEQIDALTPHARRLLRINREEHGIYRTMLNDLRRRGRPVSWRRTLRDSRAMRDLPRATVRTIVAMLGRLEPNPGRPW